MTDNYIETPGRDVLFEKHRYRVTYSHANDNYILWYSGNILMSGNRKGVMAGFRARLAEYEGINT